MAVDVRLSSERSPTSGRVRALSTASCRICLRCRDNTALPVQVMASSTIVDCQNSEAGSLQTLIVYAGVAAYGQHPSGWGQSLIYEPMYYSYVSVWVKGGRVTCCSNYQEHQRRVA